MVKPVNIEKLILEYIFKDLFLYFFVMKKHVTIGIDPSVNSTGVCVRGENFNEYHIITSKITKKVLDWSRSIDWLNIHEYEKSSTKDISTYYEKESVKFENLTSLITVFSCVLDDILSRYIVDHVTMEGVSYGSVKGAALVDLSFLNAMIRMTLHEKNLKFYIVAPTEVKKYAVGTGAADKELIIMSWKKLDKNAQKIPPFLKCDDLADAYFMSHYNPKTQS